MINRNFILIWQSIRSNLEVRTIMLFLAVDAIMSDNIKLIYPQDTEDAMAEYIFDIICTNCREQHSSSVVINRFEKHQLPGSRGEASFLIKCKFCGKDSSINISKFEDYLHNTTNIDPEILNDVKKQRKKRGLMSTPLTKTLLLELDCRGCEITHFHPRNLTLMVELTSGKKMQFQFGDENEWYDYDEDAAEEVFVTDFNSEILKGK